MVVFMTSQMHGSVAVGTGGRRLKFISILAALAIAAPPSVVFAQDCYPTNFAPFGAKLDEDLTEAQVIAITGFQPNTVSLDTCGQKSKGGDWSCKIETWGGACSGQLIVYFRKNADGVWVVNNWDSNAPLGF